NTASANGVSGAGSGAPSTPPASSSDGSITAAAAISVNIAKSTTSADLPSGLIFGSSGFTVWSSAAADAKANADGSATAARAPPLTLGAAVSINYARMTNTATIAGTANGPATVKALVNPASDGNDFVATAISGAGGGSVSVAVSFALNLVNLRTEALITGTVNAGAGGDVSISASSSSDTTTDAHAAQTPTDGTTSSLGLGASVALSLIDDVTTAGLPGTLGGGHNVSLSAATIDLAHTNAKTGAAGGNVSIVPSVAITLSNVTTRAFVGAGSALTITGAFGA